MALILSILLLAVTTTSLYFLLPVYSRYKAMKEHARHYLSTDSKMVEVYTDQLGNKWYEYRNQLDLPPLRAMRGEVATRMANLGLTEKMYDEYVAAIKKAANRGDLTKVGYYAERMEERRTLPAEEETLKALADVYFLLEGENPKEVSEYWGEKKREIWKKDPACYAFFLAEAMRRIRHIEQLSDTGLIEFLRNQAVEKSLNRL